MLDCEAGLLRARSIKKKFTAIVGNKNSILNKKDFVY